MRVDTQPAAGVPASTMAALMLAVFTVSAGFGVVLPLLPYPQGWELGKQTAAASLGVTLGSAAGGLLFNVAALPGASFILTAGLAMLGFLLSLGLPNSLVLPNSSSPPTYGEPANRTQT